MTRTESTEALLNPSLRVSRPVAACARCRSAKIKCDGRLPACSACERAGKASECSSANDDFAKGKERSYVAALETAIQKLQKKIKEAGGGGANSRSPDEMSDGLQHYGLASANGRPLTKSRRKEASDVDELVSDFGFLTVNATSRDFQGFTSNLSFARLLLEMSARTPLPNVTEAPLPLRYPSNPLIDHYFAKIYPLLPFFSETDFMSSLSRVYGVATPISTATALDHWYVRLVLAISAASMSQANNDENYNSAIRHISVAMQIVELVIHPGSIAGIQALLFLVQYSLVDPEHFDSWYLIGMASRLLVDLGLHCELAPENKPSKHALDVRRRVFYCTYALDRRISMAQGFAFSFTDDSAPNVLLPTLATDLEKHSPTPLFQRSVRPSLFLFDVCRVQSAFYQVTRFYSRTEWTSIVAADYVSHILDDIRSWHGSLPTTFDPAHLQFFFLEYLYSQMLAVSPCQKIPISAMTDLNKALALQIAMQFADQMQSMIQKIPSQAFLTYADLCRTKFVARQFQTIIWSNFDHLLRHQHELVSGSAVTNVSPLDNCTRAIAFVSKVSAILDFARVRWGISHLRERFEKESAVLLARLQNKQQEFGREGFSVGTSEYTNVHGLGPDPMPAHRTANQTIQLPQPTPIQGFQNSSPASHRSNLVRSSWSHEGPRTLDLPHGTLPRRSYEFLGNG